MILNIITGQALHDFETGQYLHKSKIIRNIIDDSDMLMIYMDNVYPLTVDTRTTRSKGGLHHQQLWMAKEEMLENRRKLVDATSENRSALDNFKCLVFIMVDRPSVKSIKYSPDWDKPALKLSPSDLFLALKDFKLSLKHKTVILETVGKCIEICAFPRNRPNFSGQKGYINKKADMDRATLTYSYPRYGNAAHMFKIRIQTLILMGIPRNRERLSKERHKYVTFPLCQNSSCVTPDHYVYETEGEVDSRRNCQSGPLCEHSPRCLTKGDKHVKVEVKEEEISDPDIEMYSEEDN